jgi:hypothetical protein
MITDDTLSELKRISERLGHIATIGNVFLALAIAGIVLSACGAVLGALGLA